MNKFENFTTLSVLARANVFRYAMYFVVIIYLIQLFQMQILNQNYFDSKSSNNSIKGIVQFPVRGVLLDRNLDVLVDNKPTFTVKIIPANYDTSFSRTIEVALGIDNGTINRLLNQNSAYSPYVPIRIKKDADFKNIAWLEENGRHLEGVSYSVEMQRAYPNVAGSHLFGYLKEISREMLEKNKSIYNLGDVVGSVGIERNYEEYLRGEKGYQYILVDAKRKEIGRYNDGKTDKPPIKGKDLVLSLDKDVQSVAEEELKGLNGALVAIEPQTGEVIAFVSSPEYDLSRFAAFTDKRYWDSLLANPRKPLFNRATMAINPPGSTFKMITAIAALEEGVIDENTTFSCNGAFSYGNRSFKCDAVHGSLNVVHAIEHSCNAFFYRMVPKIGLDKWAEYAKSFGFGTKTKIDIGEESSGIIPSTNYYNKRYGANKWSPGFLISLGIGQGETCVTPMQLAQYTALLANNGRSYQPHIVKGYLVPGTKNIHKFSFPEIHAKVSQKTLDIVKRGMFLVVNGSGTAASIRLPDIQIAGKTGTAQNPHGKDHAYFIGFAPFDNPKIAIACFVENAGFGATWAAPIVKEVVKTYMAKINKTYKPPIKDTAKSEARKGDKIAHR